MTKSIYSVYIKQHIQYNCLIEKNTRLEKLAEDTCQAIC